MANPIVPKRSSVASKVPLTSDLLVGELATNTRDGKLFMKKTDGTTDTIVEIGSSNATTLQSYQWHEGMSGVNGGASPGWHRLGTFTATGSGGRITLEVTGSDGYNNAVTTDRGGLTIINATILNNSNTTTNANIAGTWCYIDRATFAAVKFTQNSANRLSYHIDVQNTTFNDGYAVRVTASNGSTWAKVGTTTSDPGADSLTVRAAIALGKLITSSQTGSGNGLDADTVDGVHASALAPLASPALTGTPTAPTPTAGNSSTQIATTAFVAGASVASAATLTTARTINGTSFNGSANITITANNPNSLTNGSYLTGGAYNGGSAITWNVDAATTNTASKIVARDASGNFAAGQITATALLVGSNAVWHAGNFTPSNYATLASPALTGTPTAPTAAVGTNSTQIATTAFVKAEPITKLGGYTATSITQGSTTFPAYFEVTDQNGVNRYVPTVDQYPVPVWPPSDLPSTTNHKYVATTGNDTTGDGSSGNPWATIQKACSTVTSNTTIHVAPGDYPESIRIDTDGTSGAPIVILSDTWLGANIRPPSSGTRNTAVDLRGDYVYFVGFDVDGQSHNAGATRWRFGIYPAGVGNQVLFNRVINISLDSNSSTTCGIFCEPYYSGNTHTVEGNIVGNIGVKDSRTTYVNGIQCGVHTSVIKNNLVFSCAGSAIQLWNNNRNSVVTNNTCVWSRVGVYVGGIDAQGGWTNANNGNTVQNNIIYECDYGLAEVAGGNGVGTINQNVYRYNLINASVTQATSFQNGTTASNTVTSAPSFVSYHRYGEGDYRPALGSAAIDAGTATSAPSRDADRASRPRGSGIDIGAYEYYAPMGTEIVNNSFTSAATPFVVGGATGATMVVNSGALDIYSTSAGYSYGTLANWITNTLVNGARYQVEVTLQCGNTGGYTEMGLQVWDAHPVLNYQLLASASHFSTTAATYRFTFVATANNIDFTFLASNGSSVIYKVLDFKLTKLTDDVS